MRKQMIALAALCPLTVFAVSPVHNRVIDYVPAPGQFVNELPEWEDGDDSEAMAAKALQYMTEEGYYISLGAWGGYVTVGLPEVNIRNQSTIMRSHIFARLLTRKILCGWTIRETADL